MSFPCLGREEIMNFWYNVMDKELRIDDENTFSNPRVNTSGIFHKNFKISLPPFGIKISKSSQLLFWVYWELSSIALDSEQELFLND